MVNGETRIKIRHFFRKHQKAIMITIVVLVILIIVNKLLTNMNLQKAPTTTYTPNVPVLENGKEVPKKISNAFEEFIDKYIGYCNNRNYVSAYNLVSEDCKKNYFGNNYDSYVNYVKQKFNTTKRYAIQSYSNYDDKYIYSVKIFDDYLATGLTGQSYKYQEEKMTISYNDKKELVVSVGNYMDSKKLQYMASNNYLRAEVTEVMEKYSFVVYNLKLTNRSNYWIIIKDGNAGGAEVGLMMNSEVRPDLDDNSIILEPGGAIETSVSFDKFYDSDEEPRGIVLDAVRIMENYTVDSDDEKVIQSEIENAVDKFSMTIAF